MIVLGAPVLAGAILLIVAGLEHVRDPKALAQAAGTGTVVARMIAGVELLIGVPAAAALVLGDSELHWALAAQTLVYLAFAVHLMLRRYRGDESDCGCNRLATRVGPGSISRAWGLATLSLVAALVHPAAALPSGVAGIILMVLAALVIAALLYALPAAVDGPAKPRRNPAPPASSTPAEHAQPSADPSVLQERTS